MLPVFLRPKMLDQMSPLGKLSPTDWTPMGLAMLVVLHVDFEGSFLFENRATDVAPIFGGEMLAPQMGGNVSGHMSTKVALFALGQSGLVLIFLQNSVIFGPILLRFEFGIVEVFFLVHTLSYLRAEQLRAVTAFELLLRVERFDMNVNRVYG